MSWFNGHRLSLAKPLCFSHTSCFQVVFTEQLSLVISTNSSAWNPGWLASISHMSHCTLLSVDQISFCPKVACDVWNEGGDIMTTELFLAYSTTANVLCDAWPSSTSITLFSADGFTCTTKCLSHFRNKWIQPWALTAPIVPEGLPCNNSSVIRRLKWLYITVTVSPFSALVIFPTCFTPDYAMILRGLWTMVTPVSSAFHSLSAVTLFFCNSVFKMLKNLSTFGLLNPTTRPILVASGSRTANSGWRLRNADNQFLPAFCSPCWTGDQCSTSQPNQTLISWNLLLLNQTAFAKVF